MNEEIFQSELVPTPVKSEIVFQPEKDKWAIKITAEGIVFNRECYPNSTPDDFAKLFIDLLQKSYTVNFHKKQLKNYTLSEMIEMAKQSEYGYVWYSDKGPIQITKKGNLEII